MLREDFGTLQKWRKGANTKTWNVMWGKRRTNVGTDGDDGGNVYGQRSVDGNVIVYVYILSVVKRCIRTENTHSFFTLTAPHRWTAIGMGADRYQTAIGPLATAGGPISIRPFTSLQLQHLLIHPH